MNKSRQKSSRSIGISDFPQNASQKIIENLIKRINNCINFQKIVINLEKFS